MAEQILLDEQFVGENMNRRLKWFCPPQDWRLNASPAGLAVITARNTDFWQNTHYGFQPDNGHLLYMDVSGDFRVTAKVRSQPANRYDQAGVMIRYSSSTWVKTSVEYIPDASSKLGAVVTNRGYSDWSIQAYTEEEHTLYHRITKQNSTCYVEFSLDGQVWNLIRMAHLEDSAGTAQAGIYACSPQGKGYEPVFELLRIEQIDEHTKVY